MSGGVCGIYGKLPSKRDFVALHLSGAVLQIVEGWLQGGIAASRNQMGRRWQDMFLTMPIWRFWIGEQIAGTYCVGSLMPSVDGVGRYFPLTILSHGSPGAALAPPLDDGLEDWFEAAEARLLAALDPNLGTDPFGLLQGLSEASATTPPLPAPRAVPIRRGAMWSDEGETQDGATTGDRDEDYRLAAQMRTYWWTKGGDRFGQRFYSHPGMPDPGLYVNLMTGEV